MSLFQLQNISYSIGDRLLLDGVTLSLGPGEIVALAGANGSGKTTLLSIAAGSLSPQGGEIVKKRGLKLSYLPQSGLSFSGTTLAEELERAFEDYDKLLKRQEELGKSLKENASKNVQATLLEFQEIQESLESGGYFMREEKIHSVAEGLGFTTADFAKACQHFSGGWQMRIGLAKVLLSEPEVILLDEPTNYLDLESRWWLRDYLKRYRGGVILVSHDRSFLDAVVDSVAELRFSRLRVYPGNYSNYEEKSALEKRQQLETHKNQLKAKEHLEKFIDRFQYKASKAKQAQSKMKELERIELVEIDPEQSRLSLRFEKAPPSSELVLSLEDIARGYPGKPVFEGLRLEIRRGEKLALIGRNGAGKSTLMRIAAGTDSPDGGSRSLGHNVKLASFSQDAEYLLDPKKTVLEEIKDSFPDLTEERIRTVLGSFLFSDDDPEKLIGVLSGGEKSRISLVKLLLSKPNFLLLDEPTNHLDLASKDVLVKALAEFEGALLFVSHDQDFIQTLATGIAEIRAGSPGKCSEFTLYQGDWGYFLWKKQEHLSAELNGKEKEALIHGLTDEKRESEKPKVLSESKQNHESSKKFRADLKKLEKLEAELLEKIDSCEKEKKRLLEELGTESVYKNAEEMKKRQVKIAELEDEEKELQRKWEDCLLAAEDMKKL